MDTIIIPTDFSPAANNAADYAMELAKFFDCKIILLNVYPIPTASYEVPFQSESITVLQNVAETGLYHLRRNLIAKYGTGTEIEYYSDMGDPYAVINKHAKSLKADMIVMGIVGEAGKFKEHLIGSTAVSVARKQEIPSFIIPEGVKYQRIHKISFACDLDRTEETDLVYVAKFFCKVFDAKLEIVNVEGGHEELVNNRVRTMNYLEDRLRTVEHQTVHLSGSDVARSLEDHYKKHPCDVIMLNPKRHNIFYNLFHESITNKLAFHAHVPILSIH